MNRIQYYHYHLLKSDKPLSQEIRLFYEVDTVEDVVLRIVEVFADGRVERSSIALEERKGDVCPSLVDGSFMEPLSMENSIPFDIISASDFEEVFERGTDTPFWFPDGYPKIIQS